MSDDKKGISEQISEYALQGVKLGIKTGSQV